VVASDADILSATIAAFSTKKARTRPALEDISFSSNKMASPKESTPMKQLLDVSLNTNSSQTIENQYIDTESFEMEAPSCDEPSAVAAPPTSRSRESVARTLRDKVAAAIQYQLLDVLNNGSLEEVMAIYVSSSGYIFFIKILLHSILQLLELRLIGERRARYIMELREEGTQFLSLNDLEAIGMCEKQITSFKFENLAMAVGAF
jgi:hypothetical protein